MVMTWLAAAFVAAFVALVAGILVWLQAADRKLAKLVETAAAMERHAKAAADEAVALAQPAAQTVRTIQSQLASAAKLFEAAQRLGGAAEGATSAVSRVTGALAATADRHMAQAGGKYRKQIEEALDWAEVGFAAWQFWQSKRKEARTSAWARHGEGHDKTE